MRRTFPSGTAHQEFLVSIQSFFRTRLFQSNSNNIYLCSSGHQGQVERMNSTLKKMLTKDLLDKMEGDIARGKDFADVLFTSRNWVEKLHKMADAYNNTPKALTKVTPMEVHFPGQRMDSSKYFVLNAEDEKIVTELRQVCMVLKNERKKKEIS